MQAGGKSLRNLSRKRNPHTMKSSFHGESSLSHRKENVQEEFVSDHEVVSESDEDRGGEKFEEEEDDAMLGNESYGLLRVDRQTPRFSGSTRSHEKIKSRRADPLGLFSKGRDSEGGLETEVQDDDNDEVISEDMESDPEVEVDEVISDSDDDETLRNTVGAIPMKWYEEYDHIGFDHEGNKIERSASKKTVLDRILAMKDDPAFLKTIYDELHDQERPLTNEELDMALRIRAGRFALASVPMYQDMIEFVPTQDMPLRNAPILKSQFLPSKWEAKKVAQMVRNLRAGKLKPLSEKEKEMDESREGALPSPYPIWDMDDSNTKPHYHVPPPKLQLPSHAESYNPPPEYILTPEEEKEWEQKDPLHRIPFLPHKYSSLRHVPYYENTIRERFERCLDLYLCPRIQKKRQFFHPEDLLPELPDPSSLRPFPTRISVTYRGSESPVRCIAVSPSGHFLASGDENGVLRLWDVQSGRCLDTYCFNESESLPHNSSLPGETPSERPSQFLPILAMQFHPHLDVPVLAVAVSSTVYLFDAGFGNATFRENAASFLSPSGDPSLSDGSNDSKHFQLKLIIRQMQGTIRQLVWHNGGSYLASTCPDLQSAASVVIHHISKKQSQYPFKKGKGIVQCVAFHPSGPLFYVATDRIIRVYNLKTQSLSMKLHTGCRLVASMDIHPGGSNILVSSYDKKVTWLDTELSTKPYRVLRGHKEAVRKACFHRRYPLFCSCSDDMTVQVYHGMVYNDLLQNALIVPVKRLKGAHSRAREMTPGILDCVWHPIQPWLFSAGSDGSIVMYS